jgi:hypothetical protein
LFARSSHRSHQGGEETAGGHRPDPGPFIQVVHPVLLNNSKFIMIKREFRSKLSCPPAPPTTPARVGADNGGSPPYGRRGWNHIPHFLPADRACPSRPAAVKGLDSSARSLNAVEGAAAEADPTVNYDQVLAGWLRRQTDIGAERLPADGPRKSASKAGARGVWKAACTAQSAAE